MLVLKTFTSTHLVAIVGNHQYELVTICLPTSLIGPMKSNAHFMKGYSKSIMMNSTMFEMKIIYLLNYHGFHNSCECPYKVWATNIWHLKNFNR